MNCSKLNESITRYNSYFIVRTKLVHHFFNKCIGSLIFLGIYYAISVVCEIRANALVHKVCIEYKHKLFLLSSLVLVSSSTGWGTWAWLPTITSMPKSHSA